MITDNITQSDNNKPKLNTEATPTVPSVKDMSLLFSKNSTAHTAPVHRTTPVPPDFSTLSITTIENENGTVWLQRYTPSTFNKAHSQIYPLIQDILQKPENQSHPFQAKWQKLHSNDHKPSMTSKMSWRQMTQCLGIMELNQYKTFVYKCPELHTKIKILAHKNAMELGIIPQPPDRTNNHTTDDIDNIHLDLQQPNEVTAEYPILCTDQSDHIGLLMQTVIPFLKHYVHQNLEHNYSRLCQEWFNNGLTVDSTLDDIQRARHITCLEDLYLLLTLSPPLKGHLKLQEMVPQVDDKMKNKLMDNYNKLIQERRNKCLTRVKGTVRQLYTEGFSDDADALWESCMHLHDDTDDASTSSSE